eukprot:m.94199 g.94199  ORF g.94199 m.94199 type:complete len:382 (+) comp26696_c0_seq1:84-1229(+)
MPALQTAAYGNGYYFGYFEGESDGYLFKSNTHDLIGADVESMLSENPDLSIKTITYGNGMWFVLGEHVDTPPEDREFIIFDSYEDFEAGVAEKIKSQLRPRVIQCAGNKWAAYFEGKLYGRCSTAVCEDNDELLSTVGKKIGDDGYSLQAVTYGDDVWYCIFVIDPDDEQGDANWALNSVYNKEGEASFVASVEQHMDADQSMRHACFGNNVWFGYWEGEVKDGDGFAWQSHPTFDGFVASIKEQWEADDDENVKAADKYATKPPTQGSKDELEGDISNITDNDTDAVEVEEKVTEAQQEQQDAEAAALSAKELKQLAALKAKEEKEAKKQEATRKKIELQEQKERAKLAKRRASEESKLAKKASKHKTPAADEPMGDDDV